MFLFLILVISCRAVATLLVAEESNVGVTVFVADITSMCGLWFDGIAALLSACSLVRCWSYCSYIYVLINICNVSLYACVETFAR